MHIEIDTDANRVCVDGAWVQGRRRWEAAALACLIDTARRSHVPVTRARLDQELRSRGQDVELNRTQWRRLWLGLKAMFAEAGHEAAFDEHFVFAPRQFTVGPWAWVQSAAHTHQVRSKRQPPRVGAKPNTLHALATDGTVASSLRVIERLGLGHSLMWGSSRAAALDVFMSGSEWELASPEVLTHRALSIADIGIMTGKFALAREHLAIARALMQEHDRCKDQQLAWQLLEFGMRQYEAGVDCSATGGRELLRWLGPKGNFEVDYNNRAWALAFGARGFRQQLLAPDRAAPADPRLERQATDMHLAAIFLAIVGGNYGHVPLMLDLLVFHFAMCVCAGRTELTDTAIDCHQVARRWQNLLEPPDAWFFADLWIARLWLESPKVRRQVEARFSARGWIGPRPGTRGFYEDALRIATEFGDPNILGRAAAICHKFHMQEGDDARARHAAQMLLGLAAEHPWVISRLHTSGFGSFIPALMREARKVARV